MNPIHIVTEKENIIAIAKPIARNNFLLIMSKFLSKNYN